MNKEQLGDLILQSENHMYRIAKSLLKNDTDCEDAIQETIVHAFSKIHTLKNDLFAKTWLTRILINECYNIMRREKRLISIEEITEQHADEQTDYSDLYTAVQQLPEDMRLAVMLYYSEGYSIKEIACIEDTTVPTIKNRLFKARKRLRKALSEEEEAI
ncbi:MAG: RNA polymerase sigma factor [Lachnospiraceae bacterium]|nr:RNA polymerase sigma factor [Lachnospiraceae bacterium]